MRYHQIPGRYAIIALGLLAALGGCATKPPEKYAATDNQTDLSTSLYRSAEESRAQGDFSAAATLYRQSHAALPSDASPAQQSKPLVGLGQVVLAAGLPKEAADAFRKALIAEGDNVEALRGLGNALVAIDQPEMAIGQYDKAFALAPKDPRIYNGLGVANDLLGKHEKAQEWYRAGLELKSDDMNLLTNLGLSLSFSGQYDEAIEVLRGLVNSPRATPHHRQNLALAFGLAGRRDDAAKVARMDLDARAVRANLAYYATLRALPDSADRVKAVHARYADR